MSDFKIPDDEEGEPSWVKSAKGYISGSKPIDVEIDRKAFSILTDPHEPDRSYAVSLLEKSSQNIRSGYYQQLMNIIRSSGEPESPGYHFNAIFGIEAISHLVIDEIWESARSDNSYDRCVALSLLRRYNYPLSPFKLTNEENAELLELAKSGLSDESICVREQATRTLSTLVMQGFSEGIPLLISALNDHSVIPIHSSTNRKTHGYHTISSDTLHNLRMSGYNKSNWWNNKIITTEENEWSHLWKDNKKAIGQLIGCLSNKEEKVRLEAVRSLGEINAKESLPFILELKDDDSREIKEAICYCIGRLGDSSHLPLLLDFLLHQQIGTAGAAIAYLNDESSIPELLENDLVEEVYTLTTGDQTKVSPEMKSSIQEYCDKNNMKIEDILDDFVWNSNPLDWQIEWPDVCDITVIFD